AQLDAAEAGGVGVEGAGLFRGGHGQLAPEPVTRAGGERGGKDGGHATDPGGTHGGPQRNRARASACAALAAVARSPGAPGSPATTPNQYTRPSEQSMRVAAISRRPGPPFAPGAYAANAGISAKRAPASEPRRTRSPKSGSPMRLTCA